MNSSTDASLEFATLDPPGTIAVVGGGVLGVEAALYGRFLGYKVTLIEAGTIGSWLEPRRQDPLPILPDRCFSSLATQALAAQRHQAGPQTLPTTVGQWIDQGLVPLTQSDLMRGCVMTHTTVVSVDRIPAGVDEVTSVDQTDASPEETTGDSQEDFPDDFRLHLETSQGATSSLDVEALIIATGDDDRLFKMFSSGTEYLFRVRAVGADQAQIGDMESELQSGYRQIVAIFASLAGRQSLDLYRPRRL